MNQLNLTELKALAKESGLKGYSTMTKPALLSHLNGGSVLGGASKFENLNVHQLRGYIKGTTGISVSKVKKEDLVQIAKGEKEPPAKPKREGNSWVKALKQYNSGRDNYEIPKKGSAAYEQVKAIMNGKPAAKSKKTTRAKKGEALYL